MVLFHMKIYKSICPYLCLNPSFELLLQGEGAYPKKLDTKTSFFSSSNREFQSFNGWKSHLSKLLSFVPNQRLPYKIVDIHFIFLRGHLSMTEAKVEGVGKKVMKIAVTPRKPPLI